eukprot:TRINITY_DN65096_c0_g3_i1.p1 TRINITY_DN65096_c0_g3~~TRINITY_DN65096_c0_g3_i1.p1  ORF type:complete len:311 (-),score=13.85 TRINITY_DN65096_c0_g3_i1:38-853(-)
MADVIQQPTEPTDIVVRLKILQRRSEYVRQSWHNYCDNCGGGMRDPLKHTECFVRSFFEELSSGFIAPASPAAGVQELAQHMSHCASIGVRPGDEEGIVIPSAAHVAHAFSRGDMCLGLPWFAIVPGACHEAPLSMLPLAINNHVAGVRFRRPSQHSCEGSANASDCPVHSRAHTADPHGLLDIDMNDYMQPVQRSAVPVQQRDSSDLSGPHGSVTVGDPWSNNGSSGVTMPEFSGSAMDSQMEVEYPGDIHSYLDDTRGQPAISRGWLSF